MVFRQSSSPQIPKEALPLHLSLPLNYPKRKLLGRDEYSVVPGEDLNGKKVKNQRCKL